MDAYFEKCKEFEDWRDALKRYVIASLMVMSVKHNANRPIRAVSKSWNSLIDSTEFIANYHSINGQHRVLVTYSDSSIEKDGVKYVSIMNDDSFPRHMFPVVAPPNIRHLLGNCPSIYGSSQGVFCMCVNFRDNCYWSSPCEEKTFVLWNPTIRKSVHVVVPGNLKYMEFISVIGFGVCPRTSDPKLVKISYITKLQYMEIRTPKVEIFSLSLGYWRSLSMNVPRTSIELDEEHVCVDKCIYWDAFDRTGAGETEKFRKLLLSFDMTTEEFTEIDLPNNLAYCNGYLSIYKVWTSLLVLAPNDDSLEGYCVWRMEHGVSNSFTKLSVFESLWIPDFRITGEPIIEPIIDDIKNAVVVYESKLGESIDAGIAIDVRSANSYIETLLLLDH
ncbi:F-box/kelch-repeat protein At3g06240-like [Rutidosis leptorrhynchoides]|uniref:F-box/kelch-repeat protein At3g06240-like n=1 Tax=Rutidosis leptorrhynchoides TaxID=125765 RepID=UPI003A99DB6D